MKRFVRIGIGVLVFLLGAILLVTFVRSDSGTFDPLSFAHTQSAFARDKDALIVVSQFAGNMRPYRVDIERLQEVPSRQALRTVELSDVHAQLQVYQVSWEPLFPLDIDTIYPETDFYQPVVLAEGSYLFAGQKRSESTFDLFHYSVALEKLTNITRSPERDEGEVCLSQDRELLSFRQGQQQVLLAVSGLEQRPLNNLSGAFQRCIWSFDGKLFGVQRKRSRSESYQLSICEPSPQGKAYECRALPHLKSLRHFLDFFEEGDQLGMFGAMQGDVFRKAYWIAPEGLRPAALPMVGGEQSYDILQRSGQNFRFGRQSHYQLWSDAHGKATSKELVMHRVDWRAEPVAAVLSHPLLPRMPAIWTESGWRVAMPLEMSLPIAPPVAEELWVGEGQAKQQVMWFGPRTAQRVVVWLHGGPRENVSLRYSPYFHYLVQQGFSVAAVNYPGSTGRGLEYEASFKVEPLRQSILALSQYLEEEGVEVVVPWSISAGVHVLGVWLKAGVSTTAIIEQASSTSVARQQELRDIARRRGLPFFRIRGRYDPLPGQAVDHWYPGGHDIIREEDFVQLLHVMEDFLVDLS